MLTRLIQNKQLTTCMMAIIALLLGCLGCQKNSSRVYKIGRAQSPGAQPARSIPRQQGPYNSMQKNSPLLTSQNNGNQISHTTQSAPANAQTISSANRPQNKNYHVGPGDTLAIKVFQLLEIDKDTHLKVQVDRQGTIYVPMLNQVEVSGMTSIEIQRHLTRLLGSQYIRDPKVSVEIEKYNSKLVMIEGQVRRPGELALESDTSTLLGVISQAGGITTNTAPQIEILRGAYNPNGSQTVTGEGDRSGPTNYRRELVPVARLFAEDGQEQINPEIRPGDVVKVRSASEGYVYMSGEVRRPGSIEFRRPQTILQAMTMVGGPTNIAKEGKCKIIRRLTGGTETEIQVDLKQIRKGKQENLLLAQNDTVLVPVDSVKKFFDDLNKAFRRGVSLTYSPNDQLGIPAAQTSGGF
ncbi:MAG: polysaccharide biosynthesis/export family protein [Phycisphaerae bacterium]|nr:polysaccharide biosynthesis/export family protein [Phycisphaerae bacterium]